MIGREVFGYRVEELIGKGSFASVYKVKKENESGTYVRALKHIVIPEKTQYLYFVVLGAPESYQVHVWDSDEATDAQMPFEIRVEWGK